MLAQYQGKAQARLLPRFRFAGIAWPPDAVRLVAIKESRSMELWALSDTGWTHIRDYHIRGISGGPGPKLREGDHQVPEGLYPITALNPNSSYHLSLRVGYPNDLDREMAARDGRTVLGGDIYIHGNSVSSGCLAMGDNVIEELFVMTALLTREKVSILIAPRDFRSKPPPRLPAGATDWKRELDRLIAAELQVFTRQQR